ncbi:hypothetical protein ERO13_D13G040200v2 [Gossypium hirsutum]|uniref:Transcription factor bHLH95 isoform X1 n=4 Tax=Gossypium TaxID=3633 RepID=A0A1U8I9Z4_GOSHI|nr:transcription factor bHLH95 isoform X1 [Gossypium raimondii]XP_016675035.2 transcription factor bHLH95 isoform X1 [Gossypium hirsutum]KAG4110299.1 hypothetical protein ERO13_D13G040200v2 [Gossypium hirsutum]KJB79349.1 hypothetical protein B456_013G045100 [Gossypium raimondii]TYI45567.1 hypothetical protein E1A91_D13G046200v1 [Gossypium mustelinum]
MSATPGSFFLCENHPFPPPSNNNSGGGGANGSEDNNQHEKQPLQDSTNNKRGGESDHEMHIWTERERRKKMRNMFSNLHALLPHLSPKADKSTIVDEAVKHIQTLEKTLQKLQKQKLDRLQEGPNPIDLGHQDTSREAFMADQVLSGNDAAAKDLIIKSNSVTVAQPRLQFQTWTSSNVVLNICGKEAQISVCSPKKPGLFTSVCCILEKHYLEVISAHVSSQSNRSIFMIQAHQVGSSGAYNHQVSEVDEIFKQAAAEIMFCLTS